MSHRYWANFSTWYLWLKSIFLSPDSNPMTHETWQIDQQQSCRWILKILKKIWHSKIFGDFCQNPYSEIWVHKRVRVAIPYSEIWVHKRVQNGDLYLFMYSNWPEVGSILVTVTSTTSAQLRIKNNVMGWAEPLKIASCFFVQFCLCYPRVLGGSVKWAMNMIWKLGAHHDILINNTFDSFFLLQQVKISKFSTIWKCSQYYWLHAEIWQKRYYQAAPFQKFWWKINFT